MTVTHSPVLADLGLGSRAKDAVMITGGVAAVALIGQIALPLPFTPVPLTLGTFAVLGVGAALGPARAAISMVAFTVLAALGAPVLAGWSSGLYGASAGYVIGYVPAAILAGYLARRRMDRGFWSMAALASASSATVYLTGVPWLMWAASMSLPQALMAGVVPFLIGDVLKAGAASALFPSIWKLTSAR